MCAQGTHRLEDCSKSLLEASIRALYVGSAVQQLISAFCPRDQLVRLANQVEAEKPSRSPALQRHWGYGEKGGLMGQQEASQVHVVGSRAGQLSRQGGMSEQVQYAQDDCRDLVLRPCLFRHRGSCHPGTDA
jgi:hypothetical protein